MLSVSLLISGCYFSISQIQLKHLCVIKKGLRALCSADCWVWDLGENFEVICLIFYQHLQQEVRSEGPFTLLRETDAWGAKNARCFAGIWVCRGWDRDVLFLDCSAGLPWKYWLHSCFLIHDWAEKASEVLHSLESHLSLLQIENEVGTWPTDCPHRPWHCGLLDI